MVRNIEKTEDQIIVRPSQERGHAQHGWLDSYHTFSFADYYDENYMGFRSLRVINEDRIAPGMGFDAHSHRDMEIFSYVVEGAVKHKDSMGHESVIKAGDVQKITAGKGIVHSEFNASDKEAGHFLQIWIVPNKKGLQPSYQELTLSPSDEKTPLLLIGSLQGGANVTQFNQDVFIYRGNLKKGQDVVYAIKPQRGVWLQMVKGKLNLNGKLLSAGDGAQVENISEIKIQAQDMSEFLLFDLA